MIQVKRERRPNRCECGCGEYANESRRFILGHNTKGKNHPNLGRRLPDKTRERMSVSGKGKIISIEQRRKISKSLEGDKHWNWQGGRSHELYCPIFRNKEFREVIFGRDNYECQNPDCWGTAVRLALHHIDAYKKNCDPWNVISLCTSCNSRANFNKNFWQKHYEEIIRRKEKADGRTRG